MGKVKRLFFDIETSPNVGIFWSAGYKQNISHENIIKERAIICICYKWGDEDKVHSLTWDSKQDDKKMLESFIKIANEADELVGHNGDGFDLPWVRTRCLYHRIPMFQYYNTIDTLKYARSKFYFNSNKLDYIAKYLGFEGKINTNFGMWKNIVLNNDKKALADMVEYCKGDVTVLENVYNALSSHIPNKTHAGLAEGKDRCSYPSCASENMGSPKKRTSASGTTRVQLQCKDCHKYHTVTSTAYEQYLLSKTK